MRRIIQALLRLVKARGDQGYQCGSSRRWGSLRGAGDAVVLYDLNAALAVPEARGSLLLPLCADAGLFMFTSCAIVRSSGIRGRFHPSLLITRESASV